ncbi:MAG: hypothetical protein GQ583_04545 [Methyloprofundus sp.]|nr:hypothetical protein [Methyloprofundus sp.]
MKTQLLTKPAVLWAMLASMLAFSIGAHAASMATEDGSGIQTQILYAGQTTEVGTVTTEVVGENLVVTYNTIGGWELNETQLWVGNDIADMPQTRQGNPKIGNFPYKNEGEFVDPTSYSIEIPLNILGFICPVADTEYFVAAHATVQLIDGAGSVIQTETAWADGDRFVERGMWGTFFTITLTCDDTPPIGSGENCETAFAYSGGTNAIDTDITNSFLDIVDEDGGSFNRWGWSNGAVSAGSYSWDIYAGAGQSDIAKGTLVGTLTVDYDGATVDVTYTMTAGSPYYMDENHLYVGNDILARDVNNEFTVAPGQYPTIHDDLNGATTDSYTIGGLSDNIYVVAHAVVCGFPAE